MLSMANSPINCFAVKCLLSSASGLVKMGRDAVGARLKPEKRSSDLL